MPKKRREVSEMLTVQEAAARKGVTDARIYQWISEGRLPKHERYGRTLVDWKDVEALQALKRGRPRKGQ